MMLPAHCGMRGIFIVYGCITSHLMQLSGSCAIATTMAVGAAGAAPQRAGLL